MRPEALKVLRTGTVIPAFPLTLTEDGSFDERRQRALIRYYLDAGVGGLAVAVHTTQFAIRDPEHNLLAPVLEAAFTCGQPALVAVPIDYRENDRMYEKLRITV